MQYVHLPRYVYMRNSSIQIQGRAQGNMPPCQGTLEKFDDIFELTRLINVPPLS